LFPSGLVKLLWRLKVEMGGRVYKKYRLYERKI